MTQYQEDQEVISSDICTKEKLNIRKPIALLQRVCKSTPLSPFVVSSMIKYKWNFYFPDAIFLQMRCRAEIPCTEKESHFWMHLQSVTALTDRRWLPQLKFLAFPLVSLPPSCPGDAIPLGTRGEQPERGPEEESVAVDSSSAHLLKK